MKKLIFLFLIVPLLSPCQPGLPKPIADSLWSVWKDESQPDTKRLSALHKYGLRGYLFSKPDSALFFSKMEYEFAKKKGLKGKMSNAINVQGAIYDIRGDFQKAIEFYERALQLRKEVGDKKGIAGSYNNLGAIYKDQGNYAKAIEYYTKSLKIKDAIGDKKGYAGTLNNIGIIYDQQGDFEKALKYYKRSLELKKKYDTPRRIARTLNNIGGIYKKQGDIDKALEYCKEGLKYFKKSEKSSGYAFSLISFGILYKEKGRLDTALYNFKESLKVSRKTGKKQDAAIALNNIAKIHLLKGNTAKGIEAAKEAYETAEKIGGVEELKHAADALWQGYEKTGQYGKALKMYEEHVQYSDSMQSMKNQREVIRQEYKYQYEKKAYADSVKQAEEKKLSQAKIKAQKAKLKQEQTQRYALYGGVGLLLIFGGFMFNRFRVTKQQKDIIAGQKSEVEAQKQKAEYQKSLVEEKNREILDSINYAKRLQEAILPPQKLVKQWLNESFILYKPKDIVAGDFYWMETIDNTIYFAAADCTGHGVPGAMVSVVCSNALTKGVIEDNISDPGKILDRTRELVIERFGRSEQEIKDGMDIAFCKLNFSNKQQSLRKAQEPDAGQLEYAGAHNPLWIIRKDANEVEEIKGDKQPIGRYATSKPFTTHKLTLNKGDSVYMFSDGFQDQFGGPKGKKYKSGKLKKFLLSIRDKDMRDQRNLLNKEFESWKGNLEQLDDVCMIGVRI